MSVIIQPNDNYNTHQVLDSSSSSTTSVTTIDDKIQETVISITEDEEEQEQRILSYLNSPISSSKTSKSSKRVHKLGPFLLLKTLGVGEFGKVKMGKHFETGQTVAVKLVKKENIDSSSQLEKIRMEIDILKTLNHPYIVKLLSVNETDTCIGMVLEYAQGGELFEYIYKQRYLKEDEACRLFSQLISSVYYMHQKHIVHRDLKLENILLDRHGNLIVTDFGFANQFTQKTGDLMSTSCGSPVYAAPELVMTGRLYAGTGVDIWSCGIILYAMLCGYLPFDDDIKNPNGDNIGRLYRYIMANTPKYPSHLSYDSKDVISKMLLPDPNERSNIETIMAHPWLFKYKNQILSKSIQELESEAQLLKQLLLKEGVEQDQGDYIEDVNCDEEDSCSSCYSYQPPSTKEEYQYQKKEEKQPPNTPIIPIPNTIQEFPTAEQIVLRQQEEKQSTSSSSSSLAVNINNKKRRHIINTPFVTTTTTTTTAAVKPKQGPTMPIVQQQQLSLRAKLFSSVKKRNLSSTIVKMEEEIIRPSDSNRHSWQHLMYRQIGNNNPTITTANLPLSPPSSPITPEHSKSVRLMTWLKKKKNNHHKSNNTTTTSISSHREDFFSSSSLSNQDVTTTIPVARPSSSNNTPTSRTSTLLSQQNHGSGDIDRISVESELRVHQGDMNRSALTSKPPMEVLLEIHKILFILGIEIENQGGYRLFCIRRSTTLQQHLKKATTTTNDNDDMMNHLSTITAQSLLCLPIYGHPSIDNGNEIQFSVEICRFENLSGLFSVDIQYLDNNENFSGYQFIGQKLLALLHLGNAIRNTNFSVMLSSKKE